MMKPISKPHSFLAKSNTISISPSETVQTLPEGVTKRFVPILTLLRLLGVYPLRFGKAEFGTDKTNNAAIIHYSVNLKSIPCILSVIMGILLNIIFIIFFLHGDVFGVEWL
jgi:hypothetical protein